MECLPVVATLVVGFAVIALILVRQGQSITRLEQRLEAKSAVFDQIFMRIKFNEDVAAERHNFHMLHYEFTKEISMKIIGMIANSAISIKFSVAGNEAILQYIAEKIVPLQDECTNEIIKQIHKKFDIILDEIDAKYANSIWYCGILMRTVIDTYQSVINEYQELIEINKLNDMEKEACARLIKDFIIEPAPDKLKQILKSMPIDEIKGYFLNIWDSNPTVLAAAA